MLSIEEAQKQLAQLAEEAMRGEDVILTQNGTPVARLAPVRRAPTEQDRGEMAEKLLRTLERGYDLGGRDWTRNDLHKRGSL